MNKLILILVLVGFILLTLVGLSGNAKLDVAMGDGATARGQGQQALLQEQADAINSNSAAAADAANIANNDKAQLNDMTREKRASNQRTLNTILTWAGGIGAALALLGLGLSFAGYTALMGLGVLPARALSAPQIARNGNVVGVWMPQLGRGVVINSDMPGQMLHMGEEASELLEGQPAPMIAASQSRALAAAVRHQGNQRNGAGFFEALEMLQQKALSAKTEDRHDQA